MKLRRQKGVTLIEVLITSIVIGVGLLGVAALQVVSLKANRTALQRSYATFYAHDILECMRVNRTEAISGNYDIDFDDSPAGSSIAKLDLARWRGALTANLPNGKGKIVVNPINGLATVDVQWAEWVEPDEEPETLLFSTESSL